MITLQFALDRIHYNSSTGLFYWLPKKGPFGWDYNKPAGRFDHDGYVVIRMGGKRITAHRLAWLITYGVFPEKYLDHANGNKADNRIQNLRLATASQNLHNRPKTKSNTSGIKGVSWCKTHKKWVAQLRVDNKDFHLGRFSTIQAAKEAVQDFRNHKLGEFSHH
jgi:hypothetical protein